MGNYTKYSLFLRKKSFNLSKLEFFHYLCYFKKNYLPHLEKYKKPKILEIGCGLGHFLFFLERYGYKNIEAIDLDNENVSFCRKRGFKFVKKANMYSFVTGYGKGKYDLIVINDVLEHVPKEKVVSFLRDCRNILKKDGEILIKTVNCNNIYGISSFFSDFTHEVGYTEEKIKQLAFISGFGDCRVYNLYLPLMLPVIDQIRRFFIIDIIYRFKKVNFLLNGRKGIDVFSKNFLAILKK